MLSWLQLAIVFSAGMAMRNDNSELDILQPGFETSGCNNAKSCEECVNTPSVFIIGHLTGSYCTWFVSKKPSGAPSESFDTGTCATKEEAATLIFLNVSHGECGSQKKVWYKAWYTQKSRMKISGVLKTLEEAANTFEQKSTQLTRDNALSYSMGNTNLIGERVDGSHGPVANPMVYETYKDVSVRDLWKHVNGKQLYYGELDKDPELDSRVKALSAKRLKIWRSLIQRTCNEKWEHALTHLQKIWVDCVCLGEGTQGTHKIPKVELKSYVGIRQEEYRRGQFDGRVTVASLEGNPPLLSINKNTEQKSSPGSIEVYDGLHRLKEAYERLGEVPVRFMCSR